MATIQDFGRFGYRRYGIPQSGAMDRERMSFANHLVGNPDHYPVMEFAMQGMKLEAVEKTSLSVVGAALKVNGDPVQDSCLILNQGDVLEISSPDRVYGYLAMGGKIDAKEDFGSVSTFLMAGFGGIDGRSLKAGDILHSEQGQMEIHKKSFSDGEGEHPVKISIMKGPEWHVLRELPDTKIFQIDPSSNRMGIRLTSNRLENDSKEIASSAVVPGTIQLPPNGQPIVLMNDCQTTGGYPRIGKVVEADMGKLAQIRPGESVVFSLI